MEDLAVSAHPEGRVAQALAKEPEGVELAVISSVVEVSTDVIAPEVPASISVSAAPVVSPTPVPKESVYIPRPVIERGSGSTLGGDTMGILTRQMVQQFFTSM